MAVEEQKMAVEPLEGTSFPKIWSSESKGSSGGEEKGERLGWLQRRRVHVQV